MSLFVPMQIDSSTYVESTFLGDKIYSFSMDILDFWLEDIFYIQSKVKSQTSHIVFDYFLFSIGMLVFMQDRATWLCGTRRYRCVSLLLVATMRCKKLCKKENRVFSLSLSEVAEFMFFFEILWIFITFVETKSRYYCLIKYKSWNLIETTRFIYNFRNLFKKYVKFTTRKRK